MRGPAPGWLRQFDSYLAQVVTEAEVPGAAACVTCGPDVVYLRAVGWRDREARLPATPRTVFGLASLSKSFTALTALVLQARGVWSLEDPVSDHLPEFGYPGLDSAGEPVRLWHMLSHTTGVPPLRALEYALRRDQLGDPAHAYAERDSAGDPDVGGYEELMAYMRAGERGLLDSPGRVVSYSNECVALVGAAIERVTGRSFPSVLEDEVLAPLGMTSTGFGPSQEAERAVLYTRTPDGVVRSPSWSQAPAYLGTGMLRSSAADLTRYLSFMATGDGQAIGVAPELLAELTRPRAWSQPGGGYALGWSVRSQEGVTVVRHGGSLKGVASCQGFVPELGLGVAVLMNLDGAPAMRAWYGAVNLALGLAPDAPLYGTGHDLVWAGPGSAEAELGRFAGVYASGEPWGRLELVAEPCTAVAEGDRDSAVADDGRYLVAYSGDDRERIGRVALLPHPADQPDDTLEFVIVGEKGAWDAGRFHLGDDGTPFAVQHAQRWYDRQTPGPAEPERAPAAGIR